MTSPIKGRPGAQASGQPHEVGGRARRWAGAAAAILLLTAATACSADEQEPSTTPAASSSAPVEESATAEPSPSLTTTSEVQKVVGKLKTGGRGRLVKAVTPVVDRWWEAAYLGGPWPRTTFGDAFPGFTQGATKEARRDKELLSNADIGAEVTAVTATKRDVRLDVIAPATRMAGVTARIRLDFETAGEVPHQVSVRGRLFLTRKAGTWRIFGYDVRKAVE